MRSEEDINNLLNIYKQRYSDIVEQNICDYNESTPYVLKDLQGNITALKWVLQNVD